MKKVIEFFSKNHILTNFIMLAVFIGAAIYWNQTSKEAMPNITFDFVQVTASYSGATSEEVEYFITRELESACEGLEGIANITSTTRQGSVSIRLELDPDYPDRQQLISDIEDTVEGVNLPDDVDTPQIREFKSSRMSIIRYYFYIDSTPLINKAQRKLLQNTADNLETRLMRLSPVSEISVSGYLNNYIEIQLLPEKLLEYNLSLMDAVNFISSINLKQPLGNLSDQGNTKVRLDAQVYTLEQIKNTVIKSNFEGKSFRIQDIAKVVEVFAEPDSISKINGYEAISMTVTKTTSAGIIEAVDEVEQAVEYYANTSLKDTGIKIVRMSDRSQEVRNRLSLISMNGLTGFILILFLLFIFLNAKSALWVAMGIPFTFGITMIVASLMGYSINNITLAGVIIVMGMIVDDAIVVAENISRLKTQGMPIGEAAVKGTSMVLLPITASITTTCVAFIPLLFFEGRYGMMLVYIPPIVIIMLLASLFESVFILPSHLRHQMPRWIRNIFSLGTLPLIEKHYAKKRAKRTAQGKSPDTNWFFSVEAVFGSILRQLLRFKLLIILIFIAAFTSAVYYFWNNMKFAMFPQEESIEMRITGKTPKGTTKYQTELAVRQIEEVINEYLENEVIAYRTSIAMSRWGNTASENAFSIHLELVTMQERDKTTSEISQEMQSKIDQLKGFDLVRVGQTRFGQSSGSPIEIQIKENNNETRQQIAQDVLSYLQSMPSLINAEIEEEIYDNEYQLTIDKNLISQLGISAANISSTLKSVLEGENIFDISTQDSDQEVYISVPDPDKDSIEKLLALPVENSSGYLVPLNKVINYTLSKSASSIKRIEGKRTLNVYADLNEVKNEKEQASGNFPSPADTASSQKKPDNQQINSQIDKSNLKFDPADMTEEQKKKFQ
ncbi:MAG: efflux RND transporter permease subunit, partial [Spirochaetes bacterium]|nr:efflux RND transporter permease subunit [Spirochaetota bacterium]